MRILVFGDSIAYGSWDIEGGWVDRLKRRAHAITIESGGETKVQVINLGIGGNTSTKLAARIDAEIQSRLSPSWTLGVVISVGVNDARTIDGAIEVTLEQYIGNIEHIITTVRQYTEHILLVGLTPIKKEEVVLKEQIYSDGRIQEYDQALERTANENKVSYIGLRERFVAGGLDSLFSYDDLHPNSQGHEKILQQVLPEIQKWGIKP